MEFNKDLVSLDTLEELCKMQEMKYVAWFIDVVVQEANIARFEYNIDEAKSKEDKATITLWKDAEVEALKMSNINIAHNEAVIKKLQEFISLKK